MYHSVEISGFSAIHIFREINFDHLKTSKTVIWTTLVVLSFDFGDFAHFSMEGKKLKFIKFKYKGEIVRTFFQTLDLSKIHFT